MPKVKSAVDLGNIDPEFTNEPPIDSYPETNPAFNDYLRTKYSGFTYEDLSVMEELDKFESIE